MDDTGQSSAVPPEPEDTSVTVLLADNEQFIDVAYKDGLENAGYKVLVAQDGDEALQMLKEHHPDVLLMDLILPKTSGFDVLQAMKQDFSLTDIPVVILTNLSQPSDEAEARSLGVIDYLVKADTSLKDLLERLQQISK